MKGNSIKCSYLQERGWEGTDKVSSSVVWNRCCCWYCYSWRQTNTQSCQLRLLPPRVVVVVVVILFWASPDLVDLLFDRKFSHDRRSATHHWASDRGASMDRFPLTTAGESRTVLDAVDRRGCVRSVCTSAMAEKEEDEEASVFYAFFSFFSKSHLVFVGQPGRRSQSIFSFLLFFSLLAPEPGTSAAPEIEVLNHEPWIIEVLWSRGPDESRALNNRGPESRGPVNVNVQWPPEVIRAVLSFVQLSVKSRD